MPRYGYTGLKRVIVSRRDLDHAMSLRRRISKRLVTSQPAKYISCSSELIEVFRSVFEERKPHSHVAEHRCRNRLMRWPLDALWFASVDHSSKRRRHTRGASRAVHLLGAERGFISVDDLSPSIMRCLCCEWMLAVQLSGTDVRRNPVAGPGTEPGIALE
jgi:hypothetical protein